MEELKFCKDCDHFRDVSIGDSFLGYHCYAIKASGHRSVVLGDYPHCDDMRAKEDCCGEAAKWFIPKVSNG